MTLGGVYDNEGGTCNIILTFSQNVISNGGTDQILDNENLPVVRNTWLFNFTCDVLTRSFITLIQKTSEEFKNKSIYKKNAKQEKGIYF